MTVSPGWYQDGVTPGVERWFDGRAWSETTRPLPLPPQPPVPAAPVGVSAWMPQDLPETGPWSAPAESGSPSTAASPYTAVSPYAAASQYAEPVVSSYAAPAPAPGYPTSGYPASGYPASGFPASGHSSPGFPSSRFPSSGYPSARPVAGSGRSDDQRQTAIVSGVIGVVLLLVAGGVLRLTADGGLGRVWTWGFLAGALLLGRGIVSYVKSIRSGASHFGPMGWVLAVGAIAVAVTVVASSVRTAFGPVDVAVGDCFTDQGAEVEKVRCSSRHDYEVADVVSSFNACPAATVVYTRVEEGELACLVWADPSRYED